MKPENIGPPSRVLGLVGASCRDLVPVGLAGYRGGRPAAGGPGGGEPGSQVGGEDDGDDEEADRQALVARSPVVGVVGEQDAQPGGGHAGQAGGGQRPG